MLPRFLFEKLTAPDIVVAQVDSAVYPLWDCKMSTSQRAVMLCGWEGKPQAWQKVMAAYRRVNEL